MFGQQIQNCVNWLCNLRTDAQLIHFVCRFGEFGKCGGSYSDIVITNFFLILTVKKIWKYG